MWVIIYTKTSVFEPKQWQKSMETKTRDGSGYQTPISPARWQARSPVIGTQEVHRRSHLECKQGSPFTRDSLFRAQTYCCYLIFLNNATRSRSSHTPYRDEHSSSGVVLVDQVLSDIEFKKGYSTFFV